MPSQKPIRQNHHAQRARPSRNPHPSCNSLRRPTHGVYYKSDLRCASLSAPESGIFELLGQLYPARLLFLLLKKSRSPHAVGTGVANASKATNDAVGPNALDKQRLSAAERLFPIPHSSLIGGRIRTTQKQIGIKTLLPTANTHPSPNNPARSGRRRCDILHRRLWPDRG